MIKMEKDEISDLPDAILHHIFSFLNMEEVVRTTFLSKRWRNLWISLSTLNFEYQDRILNDKMECMNRFIDKVFILRDNSNIQRFRFICPMTPIQHVIPVNTWIISALRRNVQELVLEVSLHWQPLLPTCLFNNKSLTSLKLVCRYSGSGYYISLPIFDSVCLPSLKTLFLGTLRFRDKCGLNELLMSSCFPVLESLTITDCVFGCKDLQISSLSLKHLVLRINYMSNIKVMRVYVDSSVTLKTPNLISFQCKDYMGRKYYLEDISSLIKADICMIQTMEMEEFKGAYYMPAEVKNKRCAQRMLKFLGECRHVKDLTLSTVILEVISDLSFLQTNPTKFRNLRSLKMDASFSGDGFHAITWLLKMSPNIETLFVNRPQINLGSESDLLDDIVTYQGEVSFPCFLDKLKHVEIRDAIGCGNELKFLEILLKNAKVLKNLVVYTRSEDLVDRSVRMKKFTKLLKFPRASSNITVLFI